MRCVTRMIVMSVALAALGCTSSAGRTYRSDEWKAGRPLGSVLMIVPQFRAGDGGQLSDKDVKIRASVRDAIARLPGTTAVQELPPAFPDDRAALVSESRAIEAGRAANAQSVCLVTVGQFGGRYLLTALPPGWDSRTTVQYSMRVLDVDTGRVLIDSVRERTAGGYLAVMTATYPADLTADLTAVLSDSR